MNANMVTRNGHPHTRDRVTMGDRYFPNSHRVTDLAPSGDRSVTDIFGHGHPENVASTRANVQRVTDGDHTSARVYMRTHACVMAKFAKTPNMVTRGTRQGGAQ